MVVKVDTNLREYQTGKGSWVTPEEYSAISHLPLSYIRHLYSKTCEKWRCSSRFDERDLKRLSKNKVLIWYMPRNPVTGENYPRVVDRPDDNSKAPKKEKVPDAGANAGEKLPAAESKDS